MKRLSFFLLALLVAGTGAAEPLRAGDGIRCTPRDTTPTVAVGKRVIWCKTDGNLKISTNTAGVVTEATVGGAASAVPNAIEFPVGQSTHVDHGDFWVPTTTQSDEFTWEGWAQWTGTGVTGYMVSDGNGGAHAMLAGVDSNGNITGNIWSGAATVTFGGDDQLAVGEWFHWMVSWHRTANAKIAVRVNGVPVGWTSYAGARVSGLGQLFVGGSDHNNFTGRMAWIRGFEGINSYVYPLIFRTAAIRPDRWPTCRVMGLDKSSVCAFLADYTVPSAVVPDYGTFASKHHPGALRNAETIDVSNVSAPRFKTPTPSWVYDAANPVQTPAPAQSTWGQVVPTAPATPAGARVFDSFSRRNQSLITEAAAWVGLGSTETGSLGALSWEVLLGAWGIHNGRAVVLSDGAPAVLAVVQNGAANQDVSVTRRKGSFGSGDTGLALRVVDSSNYVEAIYCNTSSVSGCDGKIYLTTVIAGVETASIITPALPNPSNFTTLRVVATGNNWSVYTDNNLVGTGTSSTHATATKAGLHCRWQTSNDNINGLGRWDDFTIGVTP